MIRPRHRQQAASRHHRPGSHQRCDADENPRLTVHPLADRFSPAKVKRVVGFLLGRLLHHGTPSMCLGLAPARYAYPRST